MIENMNIKIVILILSLTSIILGQENRSSISLNIEATIADQIEVITISDIDAGIVLPGQDEKDISPLTDAGAGILKLQGQPQSSIQISYSKQITMTNVLSNQPLLMNYKLSGSAENDQSASEYLQTNPANVYLNAEGVYYIWVGCRFSLLDLVPGQYDGDFNIEVDYN